MQAEEQHFPQSEAELSLILTYASYFGNRRGHVGKERRILAWVLIHLQLVQVIGQQVFLKRCTKLKLLLVLSLLLLSYIFKLMSLYKLSELKIVSLLCVLLCQPLLPLGNLPAQTKPILFMPQQLTSFSAVEPLSDQPCFVSLSLMSFPVNTRIFFFLFLFIMVQTVKIIILHPMFDILVSS